LNGEIKKVTAGNGTTYLARTVILSTGSAYRALGVPNEKRLTGHGVSSCATCDGFVFRGQEIAVSGAADSAIEEALFLATFASQDPAGLGPVSLRASKITAGRALAHPKIDFIWHSTVPQLDGGDQVTGVQLESLLTHESSSLPVTGVFVAIGNDPRTDL